MTFHLAPEVPALESTGLHEVGGVAGVAVALGDHRPELDTAMSPIEIKRRAAEFVELRRAGMLRGRR